MKYYLIKVQCHFQLNSGSIDPAFFDGCQSVVYNVKFWGINRPDGYNDFPNREESTLTGIANLNILYNQFGIYFKYRGYEEFNSPTLPNDPNGYYVLENTATQFPALASWAANNGYKDDNAFNVYAFGWGTPGGVAFLNSLVCGVSSANLVQTSLVHEIGHNLNFLHTRSSTEHTTRVEFLPNGSVNPNFNARTAGDHVVDTAANNGFWKASCGCYPFIENCLYVGSETDNSVPPVAYDIFPSDVINTMSDAYDCTQQVLTIGQGIRARETLAAGLHDVALTTIDALYEPYEGAYYVAGPVPNPERPPLFQPGFNYRFLECQCNCPQPSSPYQAFSHTNTAIVSISKYETDYSLISHPNHTAIEIEFDNCFVGEAVRKCYDNYNRNPKGGKVTKFNDDVINNNVTITPQDSTAINNPALINNLPQGLYTIDKNYEDGSTQQTVIYKENN